ncbi:MAG: NUDIX hydrolase [Anaerolineae bacterium]|jgi:ADP-ribose pyrophosphatase YjhB (NUDIX family)|nr:NUDIX hydrolase [Anaerolineae bacterium]
MAKRTFQQRVAYWVRRIPGLMPATFYLYRFVQPRYSVGVIGVIFNAEGRVLLVEHVFHPHLPWGLPGGWIGRDEDPAHAIARELREELALRVQVQSVLRVEKTFRNHLDIAFLCQPENEIGPLSFELSGYAWYDITEIPRLHRFHYEAIMHARALRSPV